MSEKIVEIVAKELSVSIVIITKVKSLFDEGNTIPFIARYRKEATGGLDEVVLASIRERLDYFKELKDRKKTILATIEKQEKLSDELKKQIENCFDKYELEDIYLPYKPKRRTKAQIARELGLEPLAIRIYSQQDMDGDSLAIIRTFADGLNLENSEEALRGAMDIVAEMICEDLEIRQIVRDISWREGMIETRMVVDSAESSGKYDNYKSQKEYVKGIPSHRMLAIFRGSKEKELAFKITLQKQEMFAVLDDEVLSKEKTIWQREMIVAIHDSYERLLAPQIETEIRAELKRKADLEAVNIFATNLNVLLLQPPLVGKVVLAVDPGLRTGCKIVTIDKTGKFLKYETAFMLQPRNDVEGSFKIFDKMKDEFGVQAFAVGNGTGGKEAFKLVRKYIKKRELKDTVAVMVSEAGASIYSASAIAREEFPDLDLTVRGSISIGRRLQDPLSELVKIDPKSIGVGQYQHDVDQKMLAKKLDEVVEFCVNGVGVDLNTASVPLLARVAGMNTRVARSVVKHRVTNGSFSNRQSLMDVTHFGAKTFEQATGFLRVVGDEPLDNSAVHPERYKLVRKMAADLGLDLCDFIGNKEMLDKVDKSKYISDEAGAFTIDDILSELAKPNRDPRDDFTAPEFDDELNDINDLETGMVLKGVVSNVAQFGAFVDIGVHQDGMIHISELDYKFIDDPSKVLKVGDAVSVKVIDIDKARKRIALSRKQAMEAPKGYQPPASNDQRPARSSSNSKSDARSGNRKVNRQKNNGNKNSGKQGSNKKDEISSGRFGAALLAAFGKDKK